MRKGRANEYDKGWEKVERERKKGMAEKDIDRKECGEEDGRGRKEDVSERMELVEGMKEGRKEKSIKQGWRMG